MRVHIPRRIPAYRPTSAGRHRGSRPRPAAVLLLALLVLALAACGSGGRSTTDPDAAVPPPSAAPVALPRPAHVVVAVFENEGASHIVGSTAAPFLSSLAHHGAYLADSHGVAHPSQPNYLALFSGSTHGVTSDACPQLLSSAPNLGRQLLDAGLTFTGYSENLPAAGYTGCSSPGGKYARKHNPWVDFGTVPASSNLPYSRFPSDFAKLPTVSFVIPNLCHDMHDCAVSAGDRWARGHLSRYARWAKTHNSLLIVTFDEDGGTNANHIPTILAGAHVRTGRSGQPIDHYNVLRTLEDMYSLPPLGHATSARPIQQVWTRGG